MAKSIALSDHNLKADALTEVAERIREGEAVNYDEAALKEMAGELATHDFARMDNEIGRYIAGCVVVAVALLVGLSLLLKAVGF
jgi:hypothetical protein